MAKSNIITLNSYKKYCKALRYLLRVSRSDYYANKLYSLGNNVQKNWKVLNKLMNKGNKGLSERFIIENVSCTNKQRIANEFNNYFLNHPKNIQNNVKSSQIDFSYLIEGCRESMFFRGCTETELSLEVNI